MSNLKLGNWSEFDPGYTPEVGDLGTADILGATYPTVIMPDSKEWMAAGLDYGGASVIYKQTTLLAIEALLTGGWRVPTEADNAGLFAAATDATELAKYRTTTGWSGTNGTNTYGISLYPGGYFVEASAWYLTGTASLFWLSGGIKVSETTDAANVVRDASDYNGGVLRMLTIRLVRDAIPVPPTTQSGTHDLIVLPNGRAETTESLAQRVDVRLRTFIGEHWLNPELGVPWFEEFLQKSPDLAACRQILVTVLQDVPGVVQVDSLEVDFAKNSRQLRVSFAVSGTDSIPQQGTTAVNL